ncbi:hypothetical protein ACROYT_G013577 [Oculina patagonica]
MSGSLSSPLELKLGVPQGSILGPTLFSIYINDLPLSLKKAEVDIYADDTTIWSSGNTCEEIQQKLQDTLDSAGKWFKANGMMPNTTKTKQLLIGTAQKVCHADKNSLDLFLNNTRLDEATDEKILGVKIDKHLKWDKHIDYLISKLNSRICLLKRARCYLTTHCRKLLYNATIKPILEYCCTVWGEMHMIAHGNHSPPRGPPLRAAPSEMFENPLCSVLTQGDHDEDEGENEYEDEWDEDESPWTEESAVQDPGRVTEHDPAWRAGGTTLQGHSTQQFTEADPIKVDPSRKVELVLRLVAR